MGRARSLVLLRASFALLLVLAAAHACGRGSPSSGPRAYSVQLHLHGPFSEGLGSIDSHSFEARAVGCDVLWWSEHDFRLATHQHVAHFGFEGPSEPLARGESWVPRLKKAVNGTKRLEPVVSPPGARLEFVTEPVLEGEQSLRLELTGRGAQFDTQLVALGDERFLVRRALATGVTLHLAVQPESLGPDARALVEVQLSEHAPRGELGLVCHFVRYLLGPEDGAPWREGQFLFVPVKVEPGRWNELALTLSADVVRGFPEVPGEDNVLYRLAFGLQARKGARAATLFDRLAIAQAHAGPEMLARAEELVAEVAALYPELVELNGLEVSYGSRHLNVYCEEAFLPDYNALEAEVARAGGSEFDERAFRASVNRHVIDEVHRRGGLVSYNHPFGVTFEDNEKPRTNEEQLAVLLKNRAEGADLLEVGYRDRGGATLADHLWLWDQLALAGLPLVGVGVSDSHGGPDNRWSGSPNNFVSWIWAETPSKRDLIAGLRAGRVFFGDLERFDGTLELVAGDARMGATVTTTAAEVELTLEIDGLRGGERVLVIESGAVAATYPAPASQFRQVHRARLAATGGFVRCEVHDASGAIALSNPIHFRRP
ncbi:MAG: CehA/McbA family metallohydrolase [Planctomycetota bacterium]